jgi:agmatinase
MARELPGPRSYFEGCLQVDLDSDMPDAWKKGFFIRHAEKKILLERLPAKEAELYINYIAQGESRPE